MHAEVPNHEPSLMLMNCGDSRAAAARASARGSLYGLGTENQNLPGFVAMCPGGYPIKDAENWQSAFLPGVYQGTYIDSAAQRDRPADREHPQPARDAGDAAAAARPAARAQRGASRATRHDARLEARIQSFELAFRMQIEAADAFDIAREPQHIRELYGDGVHGRQTLIARRLLERGVRFVQLWHGAGQPWDNHDNIEANHRKLAGEIDQPIAALLTDLKQRGMLDDTLVIWGGEFGRTPTVELSGDGKSQARPRPQPLRLHASGWPAAASRAARSTARPTSSASRPSRTRSSVHDLHATILHLLGFDHERLTYRYAGRDFRLTDVHGDVVREVIA